MRLFLAVFPPTETQAAAHAVSETLRRPGDGVSWVKPDNLHYTLRFLGDVGEDGARRAHEAAVEAASDHAAFDAVLGRAGAFPNAKKARVIWLGLSQGAAELEALAKSLDAALKRRGFGRADKPFRAHLTIGRVRDPRADWTEPLAAAGAVGENAHFRVDAIAVVESKLSPKGSIYTVRASAPLG